MSRTGLWLILGASLLAPACEVKLYTGDDEDDTTEEELSYDDDSVDDDDTTADDDDNSGALVEREARLDSFSRFVWLEPEDQPELAPQIEASPRPSTLIGYAEDFIALSGVFTQEEQGRVFPYGAYLEFDLNDGLQEPMQYWFDQLVLRKRVKGSSKPDYLMGELYPDGTMRFEVTQLDTWILGWTREDEGIWSLVGSLCRTKSDDACNTLLLHTCGNGWVDAPAEDCDGDFTCHDGCYTGVQQCNYCRLANRCHTGGQRCGDGVTDGCEVCDDGTYYGTGVEGSCLSDCSGRQHCGNGVIEGFEECDEGDSNGQCGHCNADCAGWSACPDNPVKSIWGGRGRVCIIREDGSLLCTGNNYGGLATPVEGQFKSVTFSNEWTCALDLEGRPRCWGQAMAFPEGDRYLSLVAGYSGWCALRLDHSLVCSSGWNTPGGFPPNGPFDSIAMSENSDYSCAVRMDRTLACWGSGLSAYSPPSTGAFKSVSIGDYNACALPEDGLPVCWGLPDSRVMEVPSTPLATLSMKGNYACGLDATGHLHCWGGWAGEPEFQMLDGEFVPLEGNGLPCVMRLDGSGYCLPGGISGNWHSTPTDLAQLSGNAFEMCLLAESGLATCWGMSDNNWPGTESKFLQISHPDPICGLLANHQLSCSSQSTQGSIAGEFAQISVSNNYACAIRLDGRLACRDLQTDLPWTAPVEGRFLQVYVDSNSGCAINEQQGIECWDSTGRTYAVPLEGQFTQVESAGYVTCGLQTEGSIDCYVIYEEPPEIYSFPGPVSMLSLSYEVICGLDPDKNAICWK